MANTTTQFLTSSAALELTTELEITDELLDSYYTFLCRNNTDLYRCLPRDRSDWIWVLVTELILHTIVAVFGVIGNTLAIIVLSIDSSASSTNTILRSLAICDIASLILAVVYNFTRNYIYYFTDSDSYNKTAEALAYMIIYFILPMSSAAVYGSHVITVMVTIDRYIAVCRPMVIRRKKQVYITLVVLTVYVIAYNIPLCFEYTVLTYAGIYRKNFHHNESRPVIEILKADNLHTDIGYQIVYNIVLSSILRDLAPIILLIAFNIKLYQALKDMKKRYLKMRRGSNKRETRRHMSSNESMTKTIVIVVTTYTILTLPSLLLKTITTIRQIAIELKRPQAAIFLKPVVYNLHYKSIVNLLISTASSANFIIYIIFAKKFKRIFVQKFCKCSVIRDRFQDVLLSISSEAAMKGNSNMAGAASKVAPIENSKPFIEHNCNTGSPQIADTAVS